MDLQDSSGGLVNGDRGIDIDIAGINEVHGVRVRDIVVGLLVLLISLFFYLLNTAALIAQAGEEALVSFIAVEA